MLILTLFPRHPLMLHRPAPSSYLVTTIAWCLVSLPCSVLCVPACGTDHEMKLLNQPSWTGHWLHQLPAAAAGRGEPEFKFSRLSAGAAGAARRELGRCGRGGAGRAGSSSVHHTPVWSQPPQCPHRRAQPGPARTCDTVIPLRTPQRACAFCQQPSRTAQTRSENKWKTFEK